MTKEKKLEREKRETRASTWNMNGHLKELTEMNHIFFDAIKKKIQFMCLQETGCKEYRDIRGRGGKIINLSGNTMAYRGLAFYISEEWTERVLSVKLINDRIAVIRFDLDSKGILTVINVYGPTGTRTARNPEIGREFYEQVQETYNAEKVKSALVFIMGDFNSKIGLQGPGESAFMGLYGKGDRNENGSNLKDLVEAEGLYIINTHFKLRHTQIATWHGGRQPGLHNQIDYILVPRRVVKLVNDARAYTGMLHRSDHAMVVMRIELGNLCKMRRIRCSGIPRRDYTKLAEDEAMRTSYEAMVAEKLEAYGDGEISVDQRYERLKTVVKEAAVAILPAVPQSKNGELKFLDDPILNELSHEQRKLSNKIYHPGLRNAAKVRQLRRYRSAIYAEMRMRVKALEEQKAADLAKRLVESKGNRKLFEVQRLMSKSKRQQLRLQDAQGHEFTEAAQMIKPLKVYYEGFFSREGDTPLSQWRGAARPLRNQITVMDVGLAAGKLGNGRAIAPDLMAAEQIKYGGIRAWEDAAKILNGIFERHESVPELKLGYLYPLNKPDKPGRHKTADMTRPLIFLPVLRKVLSNIVLSRIKGAVNNFLSMGQHAYREGRSTTEVVWTAQWLLATSEKYSERIHITALDLSKAFDSLDRGTMIRILEEYGLAGEDELRIISFLLSETTLMVKVGSSISEVFKTMIGTPQGDALSPILFLIYLEHILRRHRRRNILAANEIEMAYADDIQYVTKDADMNRGIRHVAGAEYEYLVGCQCAACRAKEIELTMPADMAIDKMTCNGEKTTHIELLPGTARGTVLEMLGNNLDPYSEIRTRRGNATKAFAGMLHIWSRKRDIGIGTKMILYNSIVKPNFTYNAPATAYTQVQVDLLDSLHRRQLRRLLGVHYPAHISNADVYEQTRAHPISVDVITMRWSFLGHVLRQPVSTPANRVMRNYYMRKETEESEPRDSTRRSRTLTTVPRKLQTELKILDDATRRNLFAITVLSTGVDLGILRQRAQNRALWKKAVKQLGEAATEAWRVKNQIRHEARVVAAEARVTRGRVAAAAAQLGPRTRRQTTLFEHQFLT